MSLDPHATKYPSLSPYNYVGGNPISFLDPDGKDIGYAEKGKEKRKLKRAIRFERSFDSEFNEMYIGWQQDTRLHKLQWASASTEKKISRGNTNVFDNPYSDKERHPNKEVHYFHKQRIKILGLVGSENMQGANESGSGTFSKTISGLDIKSGSIRIGYDMFSYPDELNVKDQSGSIIAGTAGPVSGVGNVETILNNTSSLTINVNEGEDNSGSQFNMNISIYDSSKEEKMYTHTKGALRKAQRNGYETYNK